MDAIMMLLTVALVGCALEACWKPFASTSNDIDSVNSNEAVAESSSTMTDPLVYTEAPPSYEEILVQEQLEPPSGTSNRDQATASSKSTNNNDTEEPMTPTDRLSLPKRYSPFITETLYSYASANEVQLSVDSLPSYEEAVAVLQPVAEAQPDPDTNRDLILFM
ncbi:uncharacterized protein [Panulirus ornatus]